MSDAITRAAAAFRDSFGAEPAIVARAPGRVNLIGEHVDYSGGLVLPAAIDRDVAVAARARTDRRIAVVAADYGGERDTFDLQGLSDPGTGWRPYVRGVAALLEATGVPLPGAELAIAGDVPAGAGLSSSAALEVACATALLALAGTERTGTDVATLCRRAEIEWAGIRCGIMDQFASALGRAGHALLLDCRSLEFRHVPIPAGVRLVVADTGVRRELRGSAFNDRFRETREAARRLGAGELREVTPDLLERHAAELPEPLRRRARHVVHEIERTRLAAAALAAGDVAAVGRMMDESHAGLRDDFEVSTPELDALAAAARAVDGVLGSRMVGAGFGGCTLSLVVETAVPAFLREVPAAYRRATGRTTSVHLLRAADGAGLAPAPS